MGSCRAQRRVKGEIADAIFAWHTGLNIVAALAVGFGLRTTARFVARETIELGVQTARRKFLTSICGLAAFPPLPFLRFPRDGLWACFRLSCFCAFVFFLRL